MGIELTRCIGCGARVDEPHRDFTCPVWQADRDEAMARVDRAAADARIRDEGYLHRSLRDRWA